MTDELESEQEEAEEAGHYVSTTPYNTFVILGCIVFVFLVEQLMPIEEVVALTGFDKIRFVHGEFWRILTGAVVHENILHIGFNGLALFMLGRMSELLSSKANVPIVFLLSVIGGSMLSLIYGSELPSIGASGGISGLLGYLTIYSYRRRKLISSRLFRDLVINIIIIAFLGVYVFENVDNWAHLGGLLAGLVYGVFEVPDDLYVDPRKTSSLKSRISNAALALIVLTSLFTGISLILRFYGYPLWLG